MTKSKIKAELLAELLPLTVGASMSAREKAEQRLRRAVNDPDLLDALMERASIRWVEGYSDSLYLAALSEYTSTGEKREYSDKPDEEQASFLRRMGVPEADIQNPAKCPSVWVKLKERTDWQTELQNYQ